MTRCAIVIVAAVIAALTSLTSCSNNGCSDNRSSIPLAGFYSANTGGSISLDSLAVWGVGSPGDSLLLSPGTSATKVYMPLRYDRSEVTFDIAYRWKHLEGFDDTVTLTYTAWPYFASEECGAMYRYRITGVSHTSLLIDSVAVTAPDSIITNLDVESIKLFFRTSG